MTCAEVISACSQRVCYKVTLPVLDIWPGVLISGSPGHNVRAATSAAGCWSVATSSRCIIASDAYLSPAPPAWRRLRKTIARCYPGSISAATIVVGIINTRRCRQRVWSDESDVCGLDGARGCGSIHNALYLTRDRRRKSDRRETYCARAVEHVADCVECIDTSKVTTVTEFLVSLQCIRIYFRQGRYFCCGLSVGRITQ